MKHDKLITALFVVVVIASTLFYLALDRDDVKVSGLEFYEVNDTHFIIEYSVKNNNKLDGNCNSSILVWGENTHRSLQKELGIIKSNQQIKEMVLTTSANEKTKTQVNVTCSWIR